MYCFNPVIIYVCIVLLNKAHEITTMRKNNAILKVQNEHCKRIEYSRDGFDKNDSEHTEMHIVLEISHLVFV
jgi:hypothetical protein